MDTYALPSIAAVKAGRGTRRVRASTTGRPEAPEPIQFDDLRRNTPEGHKADATVWITFNDAGGNKIIESDHVPVRFRSR